MISTAVWGETPPSGPLRTKRFLGRWQYHDSLSNGVTVIYASYGYIHSDIAVDS